MSLSVLSLSSFRPTPHFLVYRNIKMMLYYSDPRAKRERERENCTVVRRSKAACSRKLTYKLVEAPSTWELRRGLFQGAYSAKLALADAYENPI